MTATAYMTGMRAERMVHVAHAVERPAVSGHRSVCGEDIIAIPDLDWRWVFGSRRCPECSKIAG
jgi:hypothetical protein